MSGKKSKDKGNRVEREIVKLHRDMGVRCQRVPLSGLMEGYSGDLVVRLPDGDSLTGEVKARRRAEGWITLKRWLGEKALLFLKEDGQKPLVLMPWDTYQNLALGRHEWGWELRRKHGYDEEEEE